MKHSLAGMVVAAVSLACAAAEPDLSLDVRLDPATRELAATAELAPPPGFRFTPHPSLAVRRTTQLPSGKLRIEYGGVLPALDRRIDFRGVLQALPPMASPEGSFLPAGSGWYPQPAALFTYRVRVHVSAGQKALVEGRLLEEKTGKDSYEALFEYTTPAEGIDLMAGPYEVHEQLDNRVRLRAYFYPELAPLAPAYLQDSTRYVERYSAAIGAYPFSGFSVVASPLPSGFGMPTLTYIGAQVLKLPFIRATSLGHEVLHNWWGNGVRVDYARGNWAEGLTTFMADYAFKEDESAEAARDMRLGWLRDLAAAPPGSQRPLADFRSREHGADAVTGYGKSAMLFFMLRDAIGEAAFSRGIRRLWEQQRFKIASWVDLRAAFEKTSGRDLRAFFAQWLERPGAPAVRIASAHHEGKALKLQIAQLAPAYALRIPVEMRFADRAETRWVEIRNRDDVVTIDVASAPRAVRLDPELRIYRRLEPDELPPILRQWILASAADVMFVTQLKEAKTLAQRFFESPFRATDKVGGEPLLIIGLHDDVDAALARLGLPPRPAEVAGKGTAQVWTVRGAATPVAVISAKDAASLAALEGPLPHYGAQSWLVFDGARALARGSWPPSPRVVPVTE